MAEVRPLGVGGTAVDAAVLLEDGEEAALPDGLAVVAAVPDGVGEGAGLAARASPLISTAAASTPVTIVTPPRRCRAVRGAR